MRDLKLYEDFWDNTYVFPTEESLKRVEKAIADIERNFGNDIEKYTLEYDDDEVQFYVVIDYSTNDAEWYKCRKYIEIEIQ